MKFLILIILLILSGCNEGKNSEDYNSENANSNSLKNQSEISSNSFEEKTKNEFSWREEKIGNLKFSLPSNLKLEPGISGTNKKVYIAQDESMGLTLDIADIPSNYLNSTISDMIPDPNVYGRSINQDNSRYFDDFKLIKSEYSNIGNKECVKITQSSKKISGSNDLMIIKAHFVISTPKYYTITCSYKSNSAQNEEIMQKIIDSFKF